MGPTKASALRFRETWLAQIEGHRWCPELESREEYEAGQRQARTTVLREMVALRALPDDADVRAVLVACGLEVEPYLSMLADMEAREARRVALLSESLSGQVSR